MNLGLAVVALLLRPGLRNRDSRACVLSICRSCPHHRQGRCGVCGCWLWLKSLGRSWGCPLGYWPGDSGFVWLRPKIRRQDRPLADWLAGTTWTLSASCFRRQLELGPNHWIGRGARHETMFWSVMAGDVILYSSTRQVFVRLKQSASGNFVGRAARGGATITLEM